MSATAIVKSTLVLIDYIRFPRVLSQGAIWKREATTGLCHKLAGWRQWNFLAINKALLSDREITQVKDEVNQRAVTDAGIVLHGLCCQA
ncbi:hypothetical protein J6590_008044 [Homalodisca vitripennis]|nr:hypothetical protein J6590_008044 [Homalodisca vitripennis]